MPLVPWSKLATDIINFENYSHLTVLDYYSRFPVIHKLDRMTATQVTSHMQGISSEHGWPDILASDNGPCYLYGDFKQAMEHIGVHYITS